LISDFRLAVLSEDVVLATCEVSRGSFWTERGD
jgi:hypothetical protein